MKLYRLQHTLGDDDITLYALADSMKDALHYAARIDSINWKIEYLATLDSRLASERLIDLRKAEQPKNPSER